MHFGALHAQLGDIALDGTARDFFEFFCEISDYRQMGGGVISGMIVVIFTTWYDSFVLIRKSFPLGI